MASIFTIDMVQRFLSMYEVLHNKGYYINIHCLFLPRRYSVLRLNLLPEFGSSFTSGTEVLKFSFQVVLKSSIIILLPRLIASPLNTSITAASFIIMFSTYFYSMSILLLHFQWNLPFFFFFLALYFCI